MTAISTAHFHNGMDILVIAKDLVQVLSTTMPYLIHLKLAGFWRPKCWIKLKDVNELSAVHVMRCFKEWDFEVSMLFLCSPSQIPPSFTNFHETCYHNYAIVDNLNVIYSDSCNHSYKLGLLGNFWGGSDTNISLFRIVEWCMITYFYLFE